MHHTVIDFETEAVEGRPVYPPVPVGVAIRNRHGSSRYMAWGHPEENNCTRAEAIAQLKSIWKDPLLFHNAAFDMEVAVEHLGLPVPQRWDDTLLLGYLHDPRDTSLSLKEIAAKYVGMPPDEQQELKNWILANVPAAKRKPSSWGMYIAKAPGKLVGKYAIGDVVRTAKMFNYYYPDIKEAGMLRAYDRERRIICIKLDMERTGIRIAPKIKKDHNKWVKAREDVDAKIRRKLKVGKDFNPNSGTQLADALVSQNKLDTIVKTKKGNISTARQTLEENCNDPDLVRLLAFNGILGTYIGTFIEPWIHSYDNNDGKIYPTFNTVRSADEYGGRAFGTRTGRFSSSRPNFQNVPADVEESQHAEILISLREYLRGYDLDFVGLRDYIIPRSGHVFVARDYSQQELRILAHYEDGELLEQYIADPRMDIHEFVRQLVNRERGILYPRKSIKITVFGIIYGMGKDKLAHRMGIEPDEAANLKRAILDAVPGIKWLDGELKELCRQELPMYTWGGRRYYAEEDTWVKERGRWKRRRWWYKMLNLLIQGSAADATKQGMINVTDLYNPEYCNMLVQVHDELLFEVQKDKLKTQDKLIKEGMENLDFDVPMLSDAKYGARSWGRLK